ncbi:UDP-galactose translocator [Nilaparvata lugens]|uniref:UDP-galactose translocator n=1 Tax=Nilaparvata lugens TaxID=108931 RepID=UPI000B98BAA6|nr:UDP-galactose translocator [Nilaparvata lugens]
MTVDHTVTMNARKLRFLKVTSLVVLTLQNSILGLSMRYARTRPGELFLSSTAVLMSELTKLVLCLVFVFFEEEKNYERWLNKLHSIIIKQPMDTLKVCIPSFVYILQNNLLYVSASHLDAATYQVTYQLKILTTAVFAVVMLKRTLPLQQWVALIVLVLGIVLVQLASSSDSTSRSSDLEQNRLKGFAAALTACMLSGFAGIYFEMILKGSNISIWMRNVQLSLLSLPIGMITCFVSDYEKILSHGFFVGYDLFVIYLIYLQAIGGLVVAVVVKYADNILKGFATSLAIVLSSVGSIYLFDFSLSYQFILGSVLVMVSILLYNVSPSKKVQRPTSDVGKV